MFDSFETLLDTRLRHLEIDIKQLTKQVWGNDGGPDVVPGGVAGPDDFRNGNDAGP